MKKGLVSLALLSFVTLTGCESVSDSLNQMAGLGVVSQEQSTFDNEKIIKVTPNFLFESQSDWGANNVKLGARWKSSQPDNIIIDLVYDSSSSSGSSYAQINSLEINLNNTKHSFTTNSATSFDNSGYNSVSKTIYTKSQNAVVIPKELLEKMVSADSCLIRINTNKGYQDSNFLIKRSGGGAPTALLSIKEFLVEVNSEIKIE
ncbi:hypothetical protein EU510_15945 [Pseudoalteromonas sp. FUC4]|uniref:hypothetical protein n=1 Tax=Pseudoalteromonas sp. FUC4 TaxID=2511201 RepID=UPI0011F18AD4|nr:hypothetical protein [Pseudoalteromonas sp. FUC4]KAA1151337.1 hypothetical protein EU510_15945 [Pseudoalteromonas sp. FUC4]